MYKLLSANFSRLWKDKTFWLCTGAMLLYSIVYMLNGCRQAKSLSEYHYNLEQFYFQFAVTIGLFCALFCSMFLGTEYSDGTIRNKIIIGHTRTHVYLANVLLTFVVTLFFMCVWLIGALVGVPILGILEMGISYLLLYLLIAVMFAAAFSAIFTSVSMLCSNKAVAIIISILLFLGLLLLASMLYNRLSQPEMTPNIELTANGIQSGEPTPNPNYISGTMRKIYAFILDFLPTGQGLQMWQLEIIHPIRMLLSSLFITVFTTVGGIFLFKRKNLK